MVPVPDSPAMFKLKAREALRRNFPAALMISFLAALPGLMMQVFFVILVQRLGLELLTPESLAAMNVSGLLQLVAERGGWLPSATLGCLALAVLTTFLQVSQAHAELRLLRGQEITAGDVFSRADCLFKAIAMELWKALLILVWSLPGIALSVLGALLAVWMRSLSLLSFLSLAGNVATFVLVIRAWLRYRLSVCVMADHPEMGPVACVRESKRMTNGLIGRLFYLILSFLWLFLLTDLIGTYVLGSIPVAGILFSMMTSLVLSLYTDTAVCAFYDRYIGSSQPAGDLFMKPEGGIDKTGHITEKGETDEH